MNKRQIYEFKTLLAIQYGHNTWQEMKSNRVLPDSFEEIIDIAISNSYDQGFKDGVQGTIKNHQDNQPRY